jgi:hypothetical protein
MDPRRLSSSSAPQTTAASETSDSPTNSLPLQSNNNPPSRTWLARDSGEPESEPAYNVDLESGQPSVPLNNLSRSTLQTDAHSVTSTGGDWDYRHPCYPHRNPHVPLGSPEYQSTRVIRIQRDYMYSGDLSPAFSNVFPEILEPYLTESTFREVIRTVNERLVDAHSPWAWQNWVDGLLGALAFWMVEDVVDTYVKRGCKEVEGYLEEVNQTLEKEGGARFVPLRRTGYLNVSSPWGFCEYG